MSMSLGHTEPVDWLRIARRLWRDVFGGAGSAGLQGDGVPALVVAPEPAADPSTPAHPWWSDDAPFLVGDMVQVLIADSTRWSGVITKIAGDIGRSIVVSTLSGDWSARFAPNELQLVGHAPLPDSMVLRGAGLGRCPGDGVRVRQRVGEGALTGSAPVRSTGGSSSCPSTVAGGPRSIPGGAR